MLADNGTLSPLEFQVCEMMYRNPLYAKYMPSRILYLTTPAEICMERIQTRNRDSEDKITLEYLIKWDDYCHRWFFKTTGTVVRVSQTEDEEFDLLFLYLSCA